MQNWFIISEKLGNLAQALKNNDHCIIKHLLIELIVILLKIADENNITMQEAWQKWRTKALSKKYD